MIKTTDMAIHTRSFASVGVAILYRSAPVDR
jgi:hypothetical protein